MQGTNPDKETGTVSLFTHCDTLKVKVEYEGFTLMFCLFATLTLCGDELLEVSARDFRASVAIHRMANTEF